MLQSVGVNALHLTGTYTLNSANHKGVIAVNLNGVHAINRSEIVGNGIIDVNLYVFYTFIWFAYYTHKVSSPLI